MTTTRPLAQFFAWEEFGLGRFRVRCRNCGMQYELRLMDNILETGCPGCASNLVSERIGELEAQEGPEATTRSLAAAGLLRDDDLERVQLEREASGNGVLDAIHSLGLFGQNLHLVSTTETETGQPGYVARDLASLVSDRELEQGLAIQYASGGRLGDILVDLATEREQEELLRVALEAGLELVAPDEEAVSSEVLHMVPANVAEEHFVIPLAFDGETLRVACTDPLDFELLDRLKLLLGHEILAVPARTESIFRALEKYYLESDAVPADLSYEEAEEVRLLAEEAAFEGEEPAWQPERRDVRALNLLLLEAVDGRAIRLDLHPDGNGWRVRTHRRNGGFGTRAVSAETGEAVLSRLRVLADLPARGRGRFQYRVAGETLRIEVTLLPSGGKTAAICEFRPAELPLLSTDALGLTGDETERFESLLGGPGLSVIASPPRSGKSTTLRALLHRQHRLGDVICVGPSLSPPLPGAMQVSPENIGDLARILAHHPPRVLGVDDAGHPEAVRMALQAAAGGTRVTVALAAPTAEGAVRQLLALGADDDLLATTLRAVGVQQLVHLICPACRRAYKPTREGLRRLEVADPPPELLQTEVAIGIGCWSCGNTGFAGKGAILEVTPGRRLVEQKQYSRADRLADRALHYVLRGEVSVPEVAHLLTATEGGAV